MNIFSEVHDNISSLPDDLLSHILSFLPTLYAVRTSALSNRWRHVWRSVQALHFDNLQWFNSRDSMVDQILYQNSMTIQKLHLHCTRVEEDMCRIAALLARKIRELDIFLPVCLPPDLIQCLHYSETLEVLKIRCNFTIHARILVGFQRLKVLHIQIRNPDPVSMQTLFRSCPVLEELVLGYSGPRERNFQIFVPTLKRLSIRVRRRIAVRHNLRCEFDITAPALECLDIIDNEFSQYKIGDMPCLNRAKVNVDECNFGDSNNRAIQLLSALANISSLSLSATTMDILNFARGLKILNSAQGLNPLSLPNLTHLELEVFHGSSRNLVIEFFENSPKLEIFVLRKKYKPFCHVWDAPIWTPQLLVPSCSLFHIKEFPSCCHCFDAPSWTPQQCAPSCLSSLHVKVIEIVGFKGQQDELELLEYLLKNAKVLDKLIIDSRKLDPKDAICKNLFVQGVKSQI